MDAKKKTYTTPKLRTIELETREVMGNFCKTAGGAPNAGEIEDNCGLSVPCSLSGS